MSTSNNVVSISAPCQARHPDTPAHDDPAVLIGLAIHFGLMGRVRREGVPPSLRENLRLHAEAGEPACVLVLDWLDGLLLSDIEAVAATSRLRG